MKNNKNELYYGDNLEILRKKIKDNSIDLCYIDPPFNSKRTYNQIYLNQGKEDKAQAQAFIDTWEWNDKANEGFEQIMENYNGIFTAQSIDLIQGLSKVLGKESLLAYLVSMTLRIAEIQRVLKPTGSFYLHCDPTASHYLKLVLDAIFCPKGGDFRNEIIWHYRRWTAPAKKFQRLHDVIFFYTKGNDYTFNQLLIPYTEGSVQRKMQGVLHRFKEGEEPVLVSNKEVGKEGVPENDVWHIPFIAPSAKERLGYPTQKPESLLERIIKASSSKGDIVLDAYCGCGTSLAVAERLKRRWIGIDITYQSISVILRRLEDSFGKDILNNVYLDGIPKDMESARALANNKDDRLRKEFEKWAVLTYTNNRAMINEKKGTDKGIDGTAFILAGKDEYKKILFSVKSGEQIKSGDIRDLKGTMQREGAVMGIFLTLEPPTKPMITESKSAGFYTYKLTGTRYPVIDIVTIEEMLNGTRLNIPTSHSIEVLKKAPRVKEEEQIEIGGI
jgi:site-specific DNA-methyltransferase (adenine-specific)